MTELPNTFSGSTNGDDGDIMAWDHPEQTHMLACFLGISEFIKGSMIESYMRLYDEDEWSGVDENGEQTSTDYDTFRDRVLESGRALREVFQTLPTHEHASLVGCIMLDALVDKPPAQDRDHNNILTKGYDMILKSISDVGKKEFKDKEGAATVRGLRYLLNMDILPHINTPEQIKAMRIESKPDAGEINWEDVFNSQEPENPANVPDLGGVDGML